MKRTTYANVRMAFSSHCNKDGNSLYTIEVVVKNDGVALRCSETMEKKTDPKIFFEQFTKFLAKWKSENSPPPPS